MNPEDLVEDILGIAPGSPLAELRRRRPEALRHAEGAYRELLMPNPKKKRPGGRWISKQLADTGG